MRSPLHLRERRFPTWISAKRNEIIVGVEDVDSPVTVLRHLIEDRKRFVRFAEVRIGAHEVDVEDWPRNVVLLSGFLVRLNGTCIIAGGVFRFAELKSLLLGERRSCKEENRNEFLHGASVERCAGGDYQLVAR